MNMSCHILQHAATHCNTQDTAIVRISYVVIWICRVTYYSTLQHTSFLPDAATRCKPLPLTFYFHIVTHTENTLLHTTAQNNILSYSATHCNTLQHTATHCDTLAYTTTHCHTAPHCHTLPHIHTCMPPKKHLRSGFMTPYTPFCFVWTISSELKWISQLYPLDWARVDIRWFSVGGFDTRWIPSSCLCGMSHMLHMNDSCLAYECVVSFMACRAYHMNKSCLTYEWVMSDTQKTHVSYLDDSCLTEERGREIGREKKFWPNPLICYLKMRHVLHGMAHDVPTTHVSRMNEFWLTHIWVMSHTCWNHVSHMNESCLTPEWLTSRLWKHYRVATISRLLKSPGLSCRISSLL